MRDLFIFSCYAHLSYFDIMQLNEDIIVLGIASSR